MATPVDRGQVSAQDRTGPGGSPSQRATRTDRSSSADRQSHGPAGPVIQLEKTSAPFLAPDGVPTVDANSATYEHFLRICDRHHLDIRPTAERHSSSVCVER